MTANKPSYTLDYSIEDNKIDKDKGMSRKYLVFKALHNAMVGLVSKESAESFLDSIKIRGSFNDFGYTGYDYQYQVWVDFMKC